MHLRVRVVNIFLASCLFVYLIEHRFKLLNLKQYVQQQLSKDYLMTKTPQTQVQLEPLFEQVLTNMHSSVKKVLTFSPVSDQILAKILSCEGSLWEVSPWTRGRVEQVRVDWGGVQRGKLENAKKLQPLSWEDLDAPFQVLPALLLGPQGSPTEIWKNFYKKQGKTFLKRCFKKGGVFIVEQDFLPVGREN